MDEKLKQAITLAREHYANRDYDKAERYLSRVLEGGIETFADIHNMMGVIHHDRGRLEEARDAFRKALTINPKYTEAALNLSVTCNDLGEYEQAQDAYQQALQHRYHDRGPGDGYARGKVANLHAELSQAYIDMSMPNEAIQQLRGAVRLCPHFADLRVKLAYLYQETGDTAAALYELTEAVRARPDYNRARVAMGVVLLASGKQDRAIAEWEEVLRRDPDDHSAQMYLRITKTTHPPISSAPISQ